MWLIRFVFVSVLSLFLLLKNIQKIQDPATAFDIIEELLILRMIEMRKVGNVSLNMILNWRLYIKSELDATKKKLQLLVNGYC